MKIREVYSHIKSCYMLVFLTGLHMFAPVHVNTEHCQYDLCIVYFSFAHFQPIFCSSTI